MSSDTGFSINSKASENLSAAGTRQQVNSGTAQMVHSVVFTADPANTGTIYVGDSNVSATRCAAVLAAGESFKVGIDDRIPLLALESFWWDGDTTGDDLMIHYI